jgi:hypothetical protein
MKVAIFHNFSNETFIGYWNGRPYTYQPGEKKYLPAYLAAHFAKHLTNRELLKMDPPRENATSPKDPEQVPEYLEKYNQAFKIVDDASDPQGDKDETQVAVEVLNKQAEEDQAGPGKEAQIIAPPEEDEIEGIK